MHVIHTVFFLLFFKNKNIMCYSIPLISVYHRTLLSIYDNYRFNSSQQFNLCVIENFSNVLIDQMDEFPLKEKSYFTIIALTVKYPNLLSKNKITTKSSEYKVYMRSDLIEFYQRIDCTALYISGNLEICLCLKS